MWDFSRSMPKKKIKCDVAVYKSVCQSVLVCWFFVSVVCHCILTREIFLQIKFNLETLIGNLFLIIVCVCFKFMRRIQFFLITQPIQYAMDIIIFSRVKCNTMMRAPAQRMCMKITRKKYLYTKR